MPGVRSGAERKADTLAKLTAYVADVWVASASASDDGSADAYMVPLTLAWIDERIVLALEAGTRTARNITEHRNARLALGHTRDVVMIDAVLERSFDVETAPPEIGERYAGQSDWDPRTASGHYVFLLLRPERIQAWRELDEHAGRTLMRAGSWLV